MRRRLHDVAVATAVASVASGAPSTVHALVTGRGLLDAARAAGTLPPGREVRPGLVAGVVIHFAISGLWGVVLGWLLPRRHTVLWGALAGLGIAALSLLTIGRRRPAIAALPQIPQWADNVAFGVTMGWLLSRSHAAPS
ncbi:MAG: hypothetical protein QOC92_1632 [Acidimicrobiaceae bacterium]|jgi:hypothetical protein